MNSMPKTKSIPRCFLGEQASGCVGFFTPFEMDQHHNDQDQNQSKGTLNDRL